MKKRLQSLLLSFFAAAPLPCGTLFLDALPHADQISDNDKTYYASNAFPPRKQCYGTCYIEAPTTAIEQQLQAKYDNLYIPRSLLILQDLYSSYQSSIVEIHEQKYSSLKPLKKINYFANLISGGKHDYLYEDENQHRKVPLVNADSIDLAQKMDNELIRKMRIAFNEWFYANPSRVKLPSLHLEDFSQLILDWQSRVALTFKETLISDLQYYDLEPHPGDESIHGDYLSLAELTDVIVTAFKNQRTILFAFGKPPLENSNESDLFEFDIGTQEHKEYRKVRGFHLVQLVGINLDDQGELAEIIIRDSGGPDPVVKSNVKLNREFVSKYFLDLYVLPRAKLVPIK